MTWKLGSRFLNSDEDYVIPGEESSQTFRLPPPPVSQAGAGEGGQQQDQPRPRLQEGPDWRGVRPEEGSVLQEAEAGQDWAQGGKHQARPGQPPPPATHWLSRQVSDQTQTIQLQQGQSVD